jgi:hypothetical protein
MGRCGMRREDPKVGHAKEVTHAQTDSREDIIRSAIAIRTIDWTVVTTVSSVENRRDSQRNPGTKVTALSAIIQVIEKIIVQC